MFFLPRIARFCLGLRYRVKIEGEEILKKYKDTSILFLANHPSLTDPALVLSYLEPYVLLQPLAAEKFFKVPIMLYFLKKLKALAVPEFESGNNEYKAYRVVKLTEQIKDALHSKAKILLYPAGHLSDSPEEKIGGRSLGFDLKDEPKKVLGIATSGLFGSSFSRYFENKTPSFFTALLFGIKVVLLNGLFFLPKRDVTIQIFEIDQDILNLKDKLEFNNAIELELNQRIEKKVKLVDYGFCKAPLKIEKKAKPNHKLDKQLEKDLIEIAEKVLKKKVKPTDHLSYDLGMDSLELAEMLTMIEQRFHVRVDGFPETLEELGYLIQTTKDQVLPKIKKASIRDVLKVECPDAENLLEAFYKQCLRNPKRRMGQDQSLGEVSYQKAALIVEILSHEIEKLSGKYIGILLPSSIMAYLLMFSVLKAKKVPVMMNWTSGFNSSDFAIKLLNIDVILSSEKFLEKAYGVDLREHFNKTILLEDLKRNISFFQKLKCLAASKNLKKLANEAHYILKGENEAVVLFTSGSEAAPKAVPLSHKNILSNTKGLLATGLVKDNDRFLATLPPFHSFGCVVSGFFPIIAGVDTFYMPDPTDALALSYAIGQTKATLFCSAPSFFKQILIYSMPEDLASLRLVVVGAEKLQDSLKELFAEKCPHSMLLEGYGITECSPVVTIQLNPLTGGVGLPIRGVKLCVVDPDSLTPLPNGHVGEILVSGDNVFKGYLGIKKDPFVEIDNKRWYRTGDRGKLSDKGELILEGRFKRFIKISAEMISLGAVEEALEDFRESPHGMAQFAVIANKSGDEMILLTIHPNLDLEEVNQHLRQKGLPKVAKIHAIKKVIQIPQLATGKIDYRSLDHERI